MGLSIKLKPSIDEAAEILEKAFTGSGNELLIVAVAKVKTKIKSRDLTVLVTALSFIKTRSWRFNLQSS